MFYWNQFSKSVLEDESLSNTPDWLNELVIKSCSNNSDHVIKNKYYKTINYHEDNTQQLLLTGKDIIHHKEKNNHEENTQQFLVTEKENIINHEEKNNHEENTQQFLITEDDDIIHHEEKNNYEENTQQFLTTEDDDIIHHEEKNNHEKNMQQFLLTEEEDVIHHEEKNIELTTPKYRKYKNINNNSRIENQSPNLQKLLGDNMKKKKKR